MVIIQFIQWLTSLLSGSRINYSYDTNWHTAIGDIINFVSYVFPLDVVVVIFAISTVLLVIRIIVAIWKLLPLT